MYMNQHVCISFGMFWSSVEFLWSFPPFPLGPIVEVIEDEELREEEDEAISSTTTTLLSEEEYQEFLSEGRGTCDVEGGDEVTSASTDAPKKEKVTDGGSVAEEKSEVEEKEEQKKQIGDEKVAPKEEESKDQDEKEEGGIEKTDGKEVTKSDENSDNKTAGETSQDQAKGDGEQENKPTESVDAEQKPTSETRQGEGKEGSERPPPVGSALERRLTAYGRSRAASVSLQRRLSGMSSAHPSEPTGPGHVWDHVMLNCPQFVQLIELFLGPDPEDTMVNALSSFIRNNYTETAQVCEMHSLSISLSSSPDPFPAFQLCNIKKLGEGLWVRLLLPLAPSEFEIENFVETTATKSV